jgi:hypothetical protein
MSVSIRRSKFQTFLNTGTPSVPIWSAIGDGVATAKQALNPKVTNETYINQDNASISVDSYAPKMPVEMLAKSGDAAFEWLDTIRYARTVLDSAETEIVNVYLYNTPTLGFYIAEKQKVSIQIDDFGGEGGDMAKLNYTINFIDTPVEGQFNPTLLSFVAQPILAILATMVIGAVTLTPVFSANKELLYYTGSVSNATTTVTMTSTCIAAGATVVQKDTHASVVNQAAAASLDVGLNTLTITVTVNAEVCVYNIGITRAAS